MIFIRTKTPHICNGLYHFTMLSRFIHRLSLCHFRSLVFLSSNLIPSSPVLPFHSSLIHNRNPIFGFVMASSRCFSSNGKDKGDDTIKDPSISASWTFSPEDDNNVDSVFGDNDGNLAGMTDGGGGIGEESEKIRATGPRLNDESWLKDNSEEKGDIFDDIDNQFGSKYHNRGGVDEWETAEGYKAWTFGDEEKKEDVFDLGEVEKEGFPSVETQIVEKEKSEADKQLEKEEQELSVVLKGPNRAFGDLIAASGITESMLDSLIALKDLEGIEGLPPLREIEDMRYEKSTKKSELHEIELKKQEEIAKARVRQVDEKGRAYGTGRRKTSVARVWIQPGDGKFTVNGKQFDVYFPNLDDRAALLRPFVETSTLGLWDVLCTAKGGGISGQVGAIRLGISRALQNWEPALRPSLKAVGFLTRDPRMVERKKPGKAKARKSFQWVKR